MTAQGLDGPQTAALSLGRAHRPVSVPARGWLDLGLGKHDGGHAAADYERGNEQAMRASSCPVKHDMNPLNGAVTISPSDTGRRDAWPSPQQAA